MPTMTEILFGQLYGSDTDVAEWTRAARRRREQVRQQLLFGSSVSRRPS